MPDLAAKHDRQMALFYDIAKEFTLGGSSNDGRVTFILGLSYNCEHHNMAALKFCSQNKLKSNIMVFSHAPYASDLDLEYARDHGAGIVSTPESEMQMRCGWPEEFRAMRIVKTGLSVDYSAIYLGDNLNTMPLLLSKQRAQDNGELA